jgi:ABC-type uncharacterized transport system permease subunit
MPLDRVSERVSNFTVRWAKPAVPLLTLYYLVVLWPNWKLSLIMIGLSIWFLALGVFLGAYVKPYKMNSDKKPWLARIINTYGPTAKIVTQIIAFTCAVFALPILIIWMILERG